jgi:hypothetical protein
MKITLFIRLAIILVKKQAESLASLARLRDNASSRLAKPGWLGLAVNVVFTR